MLIKSEAATGVILEQQVFFKISQNSHLFTGKRVLSFNKVAGLTPPTLLKTRLPHIRFDVNFAKFLGAYVLQTNSR